MFWQRLSLAFAAGALGGLANGLTVWLFGLLGVRQALGVSLAPDLTGPWLFPRLVWGGMWACLFLLPSRGWGTTVRGLLFSLGPSLG